MVSLLKGTSTDGSDVSHPQVFRTRCSLWFVSSAFFTQKSPQSRSLLLISIDLSELDQIGKLLQRTTPCPLGSANHAHTRASVLTIALFQSKICLPMPLALLCLSSNRCHSICNLSKKIGNLIALTCSHVKWSHSSHLPATCENVAHVSCPWKLLPISSSYWLSSQSNPLIGPQICPLPGIDDLLSTTIQSKLAIFITSTNDACFIQDPGIWCRN